MMRQSEPTDISEKAYRYDRASLQMRLSKHKDTTEQVKEYVCSGSRSRNIRFKEAVSKRFPLGSAALLTAVSRSADCSQHICRV